MPAFLNVQSPSLSAFVLFPIATLDHPFHCQAALAAVLRSYPEASCTMSWYEGKVAIVTGERIQGRPKASRADLKVAGASSGIGLEITKHLIAKGAKVALADINATSGQAIAEELGDK